MRPPCLHTQAVAQSTGSHGHRPHKAPWAGGAERLLWPGRASPSASQLLAFSPGKEQAAGVWADFPLVADVITALGLFGHRCLRFWTEVRDFLV